MVVCSASLSETAIAEGYMTRKKLRKFKILELRDRPAVSVTVNTKIPRPIVDEKNSDDDSSGSELEDFATQKPLERVFDPIRRGRKVDERDRIRRASLSDQDDKFFERSDEALEMLIEKPWQNLYVEGDSTLEVQFLVNAAIEMAKRDRKVFFCTNMGTHHNFLWELQGQIAQRQDIPEKLRKEGAVMTSTEPRKKKFLKTALILIGHHKDQTFMRMLAAYSNHATYCPKVVILDTLYRMPSTIYDVYAHVSRKQMICSITPAPEIPNCAYKHLMASESCDVINRLELNVGNNRDDKRRADMIS